MTGPGERLQELFDAHYADILAYAVRRCPTRQDAEDVVAETFAVAWRRIDDIPGDEQARLWLFQTARLVRLNSWRSVHRSRGLLTRILSRQTSNGADTARGPVEQATERQQITQAFEQLSPGEREVLQLHVWEELTAAEIAQTLDISPAAVWKRLQRARDHLSALLGSPANPSPSPSIALPSGPARRKTAP